MEGEKRNIIMCGFMATGKTSVGRKLAALIGFDFLDLDTLIETEACMSIPEIFSSQGEPAFRALESHTIEQLGSRSRCVIAAGGGAIVNPQNLANLKRIGVVITLTADPQTILSRVGSGEDRPMLKGGDKIERIRTLMEQRAQSYAQADIIIDTSSLNIDEVASRIRDVLREFISSLGGSQ